MKGWGGPMPDHNLWEVTIIKFARRTASRVIFPGIQVVLGTGEGGGKSNREGEGTTPIAKNDALIFSLKPQRERCKGGGQEGKASEGWLMPWSQMALARTREKKQ